MKEKKEPDPSPSQKKTYIFPPDPEAPLSQTVDYKDKKEKDAPLKKSNKTIEDAPAPREEQAP